MKIVNKNFPDKNEIALSFVSAEYIQDLDCCQSENDYTVCCQVLKITTENGGNGKFFRISTADSGWSFDKIEDLITVLNNFKDKLNV